MLHGADQEMMLHTNAFSLYQDKNFDSSDFVKEYPIGISLLNHILVFSSAMKEVYRSDLNLFHSLKIVSKC